MIFSFFRRVFSRSQTRAQRSVEGSEGMILATPVVAAPMQSKENDDDDLEAVEGDSVDTNSSGGEATCGGSCGALFP